MRPATIILALGLAALAGCAKTIEAPTDRGVCWHAIPQKGGAFKFNAVARNIDSVEKCASELEAMRVRFLRFGGAEEITGAYQGSYLFLQKEGILRAVTLNSNRYVLLVRTGDGRLAMPGAMPVQ